MHVLEGFNTTIALVDLEEHETSVILKAGAGEDSLGNGYLPKGFDGVYVQLADFHGGSLFALPELPEKTASVVGRDGEIGFYGKL